MTEQPRTCTTTTAAMVLRYTRPMESSTFLSLWSVVIPGERNRLGSLLTNWLQESPGSVLPNPNHAEKIGLDGRLQPIRGPLNLWPGCLPRRSSVLVTGEAPSRLKDRQLQPPAPRLVDAHRSVSSEGHSVVTPQDDLCPG